MEFLLIFGAGVAVSFVSSLGSGILGMASLTVLLALGLSPLMALGTFRVASIGFSLGGLYHYIKAKKVVWSLLAPMIVFGAVGTFIGSNLVISLDEQVVGKVIGFALLLFIPVTLLKPKLGLVRETVSATRRWLGHVAFFLSSVWGGSITIGTGFLVLYSQAYFHGLTLLEVKGTNRIPNLLKTLVGIMVFGSAALIDWQTGVIFGAGMLVGSFIGTHYAIKLDDSWLRYILLGTIALFSLKLILGL